MIVFLCLVTNVSAWENMDIGPVGLAGGVGVDGDLYTIQASGTDIWGPSDEFHYMYVPMRGDGELKARVVSIEQTDAWAKGGLMIRETLDADSVFAMMIITPGNAAAFQWRPVSPGGCFSLDAYGISAPYWLKIVREGNTISGYYSADGIGWTPHGSGNFTMASDVYIGLCLTSHNNSVLCTAQFDSVSGTVPTE